ncbi:MAG: FAD-dependent monooxygenase [Stellaceae bacterium]
MTDARRDRLDAEALICGGGPVGLGLAIELGLRGVPTILVEQRDGTVSVPKMSNVHIRSMEFCRRWGIADRAIAAGWPKDHPLDLIYVTTMAGYELGRHRIPSYAAEPNHPHAPVRDRHCPQLYFDPILRDFARSIPAVDLRFSPDLRISTRVPTALSPRSETCGAAPHPSSGRAGSSAAPGSSI